MHAEVLFTRFPSALVVKPAASSVTVSSPPPVSLMTPSALYMPVPLFSMRWVTAWSA